MSLLLLAILAQEPEPLALWPEPLYPEEQRARFGPEKVQERAKERPWRFISNVTTPQLYVYLPPADKANGAAVVVCPGGGYGGVAIDHEGHDIARWLNSFGVAGIVLKYRMPKADISKDGTPWPLLDAQRAIRTVRHRAAEWRLKPERLGVMGFSAGGHLASTAGTHYDAGDPAAKDPIDRQGCRPDFMILVYPVVTMSDGVGHAGSRKALLGAEASKERQDLFSNELQVNAKTPPAFLVHSKDDPVKVENSIIFHEAMKKAGAKSELQLFEKGGHGYGLGAPGSEPAIWPDVCKAWLESLKLTTR